MTAMMAFFLVMWLINATDKQTLTQVATYFNPMRLTDKVPLARGLHQPESGAPSSEHAAGSPKTQAGQAKADGKGEAKLEGSKPSFSEETLFRDPYGALAKLAAQAEAEQRRAEAASQRGGEAYRDPFEPAFRRDAGTDKTAADKQPTDKREADKSVAEGRPAGTQETDRSGGDKPHGEKEAGMAPSQPIEASVANPAPAVSAPGPPAK